MTVDAVLVPGGAASALADNGDAVYYLLEAYKHLKAIGLMGDARGLKRHLAVPDTGEEGIVEADDAAGSFMDDFIHQLACHRVWARTPKVASIPA